MRKVIIVAALLSALVAEACNLPQVRAASAVEAPAGSTARWAPSAASLENLESRLRLPAGASAFGKYTRYYAADPKHGAHAIHGVLVTHGDGGLHVVPDSRLPVIFDGGCNVINVYYDMDNALSLEVRCNGQA